jgi:hypothetical protein
MITGQFNPVTMAQARGAGLLFVRILICSLISVAVDNMGAFGNCAQSDHKAVRQLRVE